MPRAEVPCDITLANLRLRCRDCRLWVQELSRRPHGHADELSETVGCQIVRLKQAHPHWGPRKIQALYARRYPGAVASESSFKRVLERAGLTVPRRVHRAQEAGRLARGLKAQKPNDVWTVDFKGWWKDRAGLRVEPLTVRDEHSRMLLEMKALPDSKTETVRGCFEELFHRHGLPGAIRSDNGVPFASYNGLWGLSRLSAWWLALGIDVERGRPGCPQDNGAHERMHRDIRRELQAGRVGREQTAFDLWRHEYNTERPHEALGMRVPAEIYRPSERIYRGTPADLEYGAMATRKGQARSGEIGYRNDQYLISIAVGGWSVGLSERADGKVEAGFSKLLLGHIEPETASFQAARTGGLEAGQSEDEM